MKTLVIYAHPDEDNASIGNKTIVNQICKQDNLEIRSLYKLYPRFEIDIQAEQNALMKADTLILQFPFHWYSMPGLLKEWFDKVFLYGFAYGSGGDKLQGKELIISTTVGGPKESYQADGHNHFSINEFLKPLQQTAFLTGMIFHEPLVSHNMVCINNDPVKKDAIKLKAISHAENLLIKLNILKQHHQTL